MAPRIRRVAAPKGLPEQSNPSRSTLPAGTITSKATHQSAASSKYKGIGTLAQYGIPPGLRRNMFQDRLLALNEDKAFHLSDQRLAEIMDAEFPEGGVRIADRPELVHVIRKFYNAGTHGKQQPHPPTSPSLQYEPPKAKVDPTTRDAAVGE